MSDIDWSKAPSHATHWCPGNARIEAGWIYQAGGEFYSCYSDRGLEHIPGFPAWRKARLVPRPSPWTGDGLPPVGVVCEHQGKANDNKWLSVKILAHTVALGQDVAVFQYGDTVSVSSACYFRPILTPEQIAEEERKAAIEEMATLMKEARYSAPSTEISPYEMAKAYAERLYQAGYRKAGDA